MPPTAAIRRYAAIPACLFLFILPFAHTVALRNLSLFVTVLSAAYLWYREPPPPVPCRLPLLFWIGVCWVSLLWSIDPHYTFGELRNEVGYTMAAFLAFYGLTRDMADLRYWWYVLLGGLCILSLIAIANYLQRGAWATGTATVLILFLSRHSPCLRRLCLPEALCASSAGPACCWP